MQQYKELHHSLGNDESGKRAWLGPREVGQRSLDEQTAKDLNAQFPNTGIKYELVEAVEGGEGNKEQTGADIGLDITKDAEHTGNAPEMVDHVVTQEDLDNNPELVEKGVQVDQTIQVPKPAAE